MRIPHCIAAALFLWTATYALSNDKAAIPVREVTVFKDGHAFILHEGEMPTDPQGDVLLDDLPEPVIGTFWPYSADPAVSLASVVAGRQDLPVARAARTLSELLRSNLGEQALISENSIPPYQAEILAVPDSGEIILLRTSAGTRALPLSRIRDVTFLNKAETSWTTQESRNRLQLDLDWKGRTPHSTAQVGMVYLQKGIRWIPSYKVVLEEGKKAHIRLQATLINEIADLQGVTAHLVIGVPSFAFEGNLDPISLQESAAQLSQHFRTDQRTAYAFSNALMSQTIANLAEASPSGGDPGSESWDDQLSGSAKNEDLFVFTVERVSLKKGDRMVVPIVEFELAYEDVFALDLPFSPPPDIWQSLNDSRQGELARLMSKPMVRHRIRLRNKSPYPLTTAPALLLRDGRLLAQGMMTYTAIGGACDLEAGDAVDIQVNKEEEEIRRVPDAVKWRGDSYARVDLQGSIQLTNRRGTGASIEVTRWVLGNMGKADSNAEVTNINLSEDGGFLPPGRYPFWWGWYSWPYWWHHFNSVSRITWKFELQDQESHDLSYSWHYFWR